jgi:hypothetical protein
VEGISYVRGHRPDHGIVQIWIAPPSLTRTQGSGAPADRLPRHSRTDLHAELRYEYGYGGSYPAFQRQLRRRRPAVVRDPEIRFETGPGLQTQADWAHLGLWPLGDQMVELYASSRRHGTDVRSRRVY